MVYGQIVGRARLELARTHVHETLIFARLPITTSAVNLVDTERVELSILFRQWILSPPCIPIPPDIDNKRLSGHDPEIQTWKDCVFPTTP